MSSVLTGRKCQLFRAQIDPMINAKSKLAHMCTPSDGIDDAELTPVGIYVKTTLGQEHLIPYANIQSIKLAPEAANVTEIKPRLGRPPKGVA